MVKTEKGIDVSQLQFLSNTETSDNCGNFTLLNWNNPADVNEKEEKTETDQGKTGGNWIGIHSIEGAPVYVCVVWATTKALSL